MVVPLDMIENRIFDEMKLGDTASLVRTLSREDIELFAIMSGDVNPAHVDDDYARSDMFHKIIAHGMWGASLISTLLGTKLPGPGTIYLGQTLHFERPVTVGDSISVTVTVTAKEAANRTGGPKISAGGSAVSVWVIPTDEDLMIACHTKDIIHVTGNHVTTRLDSDMSLC